MTHEEEVDDIIDGLLGNVWIFIYSNENSLHRFIHHLVKLDTNGNVISDCLCGAILPGKYVARLDNSYFRVIDDLCPLCVSLLKSNPTKYGFTCKYRGEKIFSANRIDNIFSKSYVKSFL